MDQLKCGLERALIDALPGSTKLTRLDQWQDKGLRHGLFQPSLQTPVFQLSLSLRRQPSFVARGPMQILARKELNPRKSHVVTKTTTILSPSLMNSCQTLPLLVLHIVGIEIRTWN